MEKLDRNCTITPMCIVLFEIFPSKPKSVVGDKSIVICTFFYPNRVQQCHWEEGLAKANS